MISYDIQDGHTSYMTREFIQPICDFLGENRDTMEVHIGKKHTDTFECGLCKFAAGNVDNLELHLATCEIYECHECEIKEKSLSSIKNYVEKRHSEGYNWIDTMQMRLAL